MDFDVSNLRFSTLTDRVEHVIKLHQPHDSQNVINCLGPVMLVEEISDLCVSSLVVNLCRRCHVHTFNLYPHPPAAFTYWDACKPFELSLSLTHSYTLENHHAL